MASRAAEHREKGAGDEEAAAVAGLMITAAATNLHRDDHTQRLTIMTVFLDSEYDYCLDG